MPRAESAGGAVEHVAAGAAVEALEACAEPPAPWPGAADAEVGEGGPAATHEEPTPAPVPDGRPTLPEVPVEPGEGALTLTREVLEGALLERTLSAALNDAKRSQDASHACFAGDSGRAKGERVPQEPETRAAAALKAPAREAADAEAQTALTSEKLAGLELLGPKNKKLKVMLEELKMKFKDMLERCRAKGVEIHAEVEASAEEVGLMPILRAKSVFERLYDDALERLARLNRLHAAQQQAAGSPQARPSAERLGSLLRLVEESSLAEQLQQEEQLMIAAARCPLRSRRPQPPPEEMAAATGTLGSPGGRRAYPHGVVCQELRPRLPVVLEEPEGVTSPSARRESVRARCADLWCPAQGRAAHRGAARASLSVASPSHALPSLRRADSLPNLVTPRAAAASLQRSSSTPHARTRACHRKN